MADRMVVSASPFQTAPFFMITPQTHPRYFRRECVGLDGFEYIVPVYIWAALHELVSDSDIATYKKLKPEEVDASGQVTFANFEVWYSTSEGRKARQRAAAHILFTPVGDAPPIDEVYDLLTSTQIMDAFNFTPPTSKNKKSEPGTLASNGADSQATQAEASSQ
jgi:hypothetical protein